ncbi:MAG TPA: CDP-alcohol phosphatidyltransferase family protein [Candidatus Paceibacterota bacterium]
MLPEQQPTVADLIIKKTLLWAVPQWVKPNWITVLRFMTIPVVLYLLVAEYYWSSIILFTISAFSDAVDGAIARTRNLITDWGKVYDPFADKLLIGTVTAIIVTRYISPYLAMVILVIDLLLIINALYKKNVQHKVIQALFAGKMKMMLQSVGLWLLLANLVVTSSALVLLATYLLYVAVLFALASLIVYRSV